MSKKNTKSVGTPSEGVVSWPYDYRMRVVITPERLAAALARLGKDQQEVARLAKLCPETISRALHGHPCMRVQTYEKLVKVLGDFGGRRVMVGDHA